MECKRFLKIQVQTLSTYLVKDWPTQNKTLICYVRYGPKVHASSKHSEDLSPAKRNESDLRIGERGKRRLYNKFADQYIRTKKNTDPRTKPLPTMICSWSTCVQGTNLLNIWAWLEPAMIHEEIAGTREEDSKEPYQGSRTRRAQAGHTSVSTSGREKRTLSVVILHQTRGPKNRVQDTGMNLCSEGGKQSFQV